MKHNEICTEIQGFPGYWVSNKGKVYSDKSGKLKPLRLKKTKHGYLVARLHQDSKVHEKSVHRLVAEAFIPNPEKLPEVNHKDENKTNNSTDNLEWITHEDNNRYSKCKPVIDISTGAIYRSAIEASLMFSKYNSAIKNAIRVRNGIYKGHRFMYLPRATEESVNTITFFAKKYEIPEIFDEYDFVKLFEID